jgi:hypothetical protein
MSYSSFNNANLTASTKTANIMAGDVNEFVSQRSLVNIYGVASAGAIKITVLADSDVAIDDKEIVAIGTSLDKSQHLLDSFEVFPGTRLSVFLRETGAVSTTDVLTGVEIIPTGR